MELYISGYLEIKNPLKTMGGEKWSIVVGYLCYVLAFIVLPSMIIWVMIQDRKTLLEVDFRETWSAAYSDIKIHSLWTRSFYFVYILRRFIFLSVGFFIRGLPTFQILYILSLNLFMTIYQG